MYRLILTLALALAGLTLASPAHAAPGAVRLEAPTRHVAHVHIVKARDTGRRTLVRFNTRSLWHLPDCKREDSRNCYWDAHRHGNGRGRSFADIGGRTYYK